MEKELDIHYYSQRLDSILSKIKESDFSEKNKKLIVDFHNSCFSEGIGKAKIGRYLHDLRKIVKILNKDLDEVNKEDIQRVLAEIEKTDYAYNTKRGFRIILKKFYKWLRNTEDVYPPEVRWIKTTAKMDKQRLPEDLLNEEEILKLIQNADNTRDKALIAVLYESGCRIGELATLKIRNIEFDEFGAKINVFGKTGSRIVRLVTSAPYLLELVNNHSSNKISNSYLWLSKKNEPICYGRIRDILERIAVKAEIKKKVNPHNFRHSRATYLAKHLSDAKLKAIMGWTQSSKMSATYIHLSQRDTKEAILELNGIKKSQVEKSKIELKFCIRCKHTNKPTNKFCELCGMVLDKEEANKIIDGQLEKNKVSELMEKLVKDPEFMELLNKKINVV